MNAFEIIGGKKLKGDITPQGAKNEALQILSAVLLTEEKITISNISHSYSTAFHIFFTLSIKNS